MKVATALPSFASLLLAGVLLLAPLWVQAQEMAELPAADKQAIQSYTLNDDVLNRLMATSKDAKAEQIQATPNDFSQVHNLDDLARQTISSNSQLAPLVKKHGFTPREFLLANLALMNAGMAATAKAHPEMAKYLDKSEVNPANVAFYEAHQAQIQAMMRGSQQ